MIVVYQTFRGLGLHRFLDLAFTPDFSLREPSECLWMVPNLVNPYG